MNSKPMIILVNINKLVFLISGFNLLASTILFITQFLLICLIKLKSFHLYVNEINFKLLTYL